VSPREARRRVAAARVARLATRDLDGRLHLVPLCFVLARDTVYSAVDAKPKRSRALRRLANVAADPDVCLLVDEYGEDWAALWWVRLRGRGRVLESGDERDRAVGALRAKYPQYATDPLDGAVLAIDIDEWSSWRPRRRE
jgi:PPOX class probable F420-dependent enzyme